MHLKPEEMGIEGASSLALGGLFGGVIPVGALFYQAEGEGQGLRQWLERVESWECTTHFSYKIEMYR